MIRTAIQDNFYSHLLKKDVKDCSFSLNLGELRNLIPNVESIKLCFPHHVAKVTRNIVWKLARGYCFTLE